MNLDCLIGCKINYNPKKNCYGESDLLGTCIGWGYNEEGLCLTMINEENGELIVKSIKSVMVDQKDISKVMIKING